jgi:hypothetical protein
VISISGSSLRALEAAFVPAATPPTITSRIDRVLPPLSQEGPQTCPGAFG